MVFPFVSVLGIPCASVETVSPEPQSVGSVACLLNTQGSLQKQFLPRLISPKIIHTCDQCVYCEMHFCVASETKANIYFRCLASLTEAFSCKRCLYVGPIRQVLFSFMLKTLNSFNIDNSLI